MTYTVSSPLGIVTRDTYEDAVAETERAIGVRAQAQGKTFRLIVDVKGVRGFRATDGSEAVVFVIEPTPTVPDLPPGCNSWVVTRPDGQVREMYLRGNAEKAAAADWRIETAIDYLHRINQENRA